MWIVLLSFVWWCEGFSLVCTIFVSCLCPIEFICDFEFTSPSMVCNFICKECVKLVLHGYSWWHLACLGSYYASKCLLCAWIVCLFCWLRVYDRSGKVILETFPAFWRLRSTVTYADVISSLFPAFSRLGSTVTYANVISSLFFL